MSESMIVGVDHGYAAMKTAHFSFPSGLVAYEHEPYTLKDVLEYGGKFYVVGSGRQALQKNKTQTEDYYLLTLAAIAKELSFRHAEPAAEIHLAAGLPLTSFGREKNAFREYLLRDGKTVNFRYEGQEYSIAIRKVSLFPQGYAAVLTQSILLDEPSVIVADIGGWTVDLMRLDNRIPNASTCRSLELGMIRCLDEIGEQIRRTLGLSMTAAQMESVLRGDAVHINEDARKIIDRQADAYVHRLLSAITESGLDTRAMPAVFLGGGAALLKRNVSAADGLCRPVILDDVSLNAKGYPAFFFVLGKAAKAQETQSYQRFQHVGRTDFNTSGTNGSHSLSLPKAGTHSPAPAKSHTAAHTAKQGGYWRGYPACTVRLEREKLFL